MMKQKLLFIAILILVVLVGTARELTRENSGLKYLKYYSNKEYNKSPQNWVIGQDQRGVIYAANQGGVLQFDGLSWESIDIPNKSARSLAIGDDGLVYIGGENQIGRLIPDCTGKLCYEPLLDFINENQRNFATVWRANTTKKGIFFRAKKYLFYWNPNSRQMETWLAKYEFNASFSCRNTFYIHDRNVGLMHIADGSPRLVPGGEAFAGIKIFMMVPYGENQLLVGTQENGFFIYDGAARVPFTTEADEYLRSNPLYHGIGISSGEFALATNGGGLVIIDDQGRLKRIFSKAAGLPDNNVKWVFEDCQGNLWLALSKGIAKIEYNSPLSIYNDQTGLPGLVLAVVKHQDILYSGTSEGLFFLSPTGDFNQIPGIPGNCFSLLSTGQSLLVGTTHGVYGVQKNNTAVQKIFVSSPSYYLLRSTVNPARVWLATKSGLASLYLKNRDLGRQCELERIFDNIKQEIRTIAEDTRGNLWLGPYIKGVIKLDFKTVEEFPGTYPIQYSSDHGLPEGPVHIYPAAGHVIYATEKGIFRFDEKNQHFSPDHTLGKEFAGGVDSPNIFLLKEDRTGRIWFHSCLRNFQAIPRQDGSYRICSQPFLRISPMQVNDIFIEGDTAWFAGNDGLIRFDAACKKDYQQDYSAIIRRVIVNERAFFFDYHGSIRNPAGYSFPIFPYRDRNLRFEFAAPFFENEMATVYRSILQGYDSQWSSWSSETWENYTNLDAGEYRFKVQAKNVFAHLSREGVFTFKVQPPWYRTWWAFFLYVLGFLFSVFYGAKWRFLKLEKEKQRLEQIVEERTKEINQKNLQLEKQTGQLKEQSAALQEMDRVKYRFFANISHEFRTPLTLIMGPLEQMLMDSRDNKQKEQVDLMLRSSQRLLTLINQLLDLSRFDSGKMKLKAARENVIPVLKSIAASFRPLTEKNQVQLELNCREEQVYLYFNREKLEEIMYNLLINATKFTPPGGKITVSITKVFSKGGWHPQPIHGQTDAVLSEASSQKFAGKAKYQELLEKNDESASPGEFLQVSVRDTGIGIPKNQLAHIFDRFYQAETSGEQTQKGSGIGLALTKELVCLHHGDIDVTSGEGQGTEFLIRLPLGEEHLSPEDMATPSDKASPSLPGGDIAARCLTGETDRADESIEEKREDAAGKETPKTVILVVEDNAEMRKYIRGALASQYKVIEAGNGREGFDIAKEVVPDLIVSDIMMPAVDGYQLCHAVKNDINTSHIPVILLTAKASEQNIIQGLETGADDYITKPFNTKILLTRIKNLIDLRRQLQLKIQRQKMLLPVEIPVSSMDETFLKELQQIVEKNLSDPDFTVELLCKKLVMGRTNLFKKVEALTGETPKQFIQSYRLERGYRLLKANFGNVTEVAFEVGFSSTAYFTKCFKEKYQCLPSTVLTSEAESK
jgi:signal transduction histidine kinase/DNA-binding response OmpR family regulator